MKIFRTLMASAILLLFASGAAWGNFINGVDVGSVDPLLKETNDLKEFDENCPTGGSPSAEICWINGALSSLGRDETAYGTKEEPVSYQFVDGSETLIAFQLWEPTEYFLIKNAQWWGLFENVANLNWAVIDTSTIAGGFNLPDSGNLEISHVATIGDTVPVPAPGVLALLGFGLVGLALVRRRMI